MTPPGILQGPEPEDEAEHFELCVTCGQAFDMRDLEQVLYHDEEMHEPMRSVEGR